MKTQTKAIVASVVVIALCLSAVSGITYSWFSDTEQADVEISTAKIDVDMSISEVTATKIDGSNLQETNDTTAEINSATNSIEVTNLMADRAIKAKVDITNQSTVSIGYRLYVDASDLSELAAYITLSVSNDGSTYSPLPANGGISYVKGSDSTLVTDDTFCNVPSTAQTFYLKLDVSSSATSFVVDGSIGIILEAYQYDAEVDPVDPSEPTVIPDSGISIKNDGASTGESFSKANADTSKPITDIVISFDKQIIENATDGTTLNATFGTTEGIEIEGIGTITLTLSDGDTQIHALGGTATVTVTINTEVQSPVIYYLAEDGTKEPMTVISSTYDTVTGTTEISFVTNHFSTFIIDGKTPVGVVDSTTYYDETGFITALQTGTNASLLSDINCGIRLTNANNLALNLNGHKISSPTTGIIVDGGTVASLIGGEIDYKNYGLYIMNNATVSTVDLTIQASGSEYYDAICINKGKINKISGGSYLAYSKSIDTAGFEYPLVGTMGLYIGSEGSVEEISGGTFQGTSVSFRNYNSDGISKVTGGTFKEPVVDRINNKVFGDSSTYCNLYYNNAPKEITGGLWFNGQSKLHSGFITTGYELSQSSEYVSYENIVTGNNINLSGTIYYYEVVSSTSS